MQYSTYDNSYGSFGNGFANSFGMNAPDAYGNDQGPSYYNNPNSALYSYGVQSGSPYADMAFDGGMAHPYSAWWNGDDNAYGGTPQAAAAPAQKKAADNGDWSKRSFWYNNIKAGRPGENGSKPGGSAFFGGRAGFGSGNVFAPAMTQAQLEYMKGDWGKKVPKQKDFNKTINRLGLYE
jgi:hypothetical protein